MICKYSCKKDLVGIDSNFSFGLEFTDLSSGISGYRTGAIDYVPEDGGVTCNRCKFIDKMISNTIIKEVWWVDEQQCFIRGNIRIDKVFNLVSDPKKIYHTHYLIQETPFKEESNGSLYDRIIDLE